MRPVVSSPLGIALVAWSACNADSSREQRDIAGLTTTSSGGSTRGASDATSDSGGEAGTTSDSTASHSTDDALRFDLGAVDLPTATAGDPIECDQDVDIVFVMDVSTSMGPFLNRLAAEILVVDEALAQLGLPSAPSYGLVVFVDDVAVSRSGSPYPDVMTLQADFLDWADFTSGNRQIGEVEINTTWTENSLDALRAAADQFSWRPADSTLRMVIHTTDDTFWEGPRTADGQYITHGYDQTVTRLQQQQIRVFSFAAALGGQCECLDVSAGWSADYMGKPAIPEATDGGVFDIDQVLAEQVSLSDAIGQAIDQSLCTTYTPVG